MSDILVLILRRLRAPLVTLISVYAISVFGLALMPGVDPQGQPWRMGLFDAFYVMSYTATTIGFGEIPYPFSYAQRLWMTLSIYLTVIGWAYALGSIFALTRNTAFRQAIERHRFEARVRRMTDPFFVICGYGQSGRRLVAALDEIGFGTVVLEPDAQRARAHLVLDTRQATALLMADARSPEVLLAAGVAKPECAGLLAPSLPVLARVGSPGARDTLESFGETMIVNTYETFAFNFRMALTQPDSLRLEDCLSGVPGAALPPRIEAPRGHWIVAGYGRFGHGIAAALETAGQSWKAIEIDPAHCGEQGIVGSALAEEALRRAGIEQACGIVAGTDVDANNLAIITNARRLKRRLFTVIRQNAAGNRSLIEAARADLEFVQAALMTNECVQLLTTPLLNRFLLKARQQPNAWAVGVLGRLRDALGDTVPHTWALLCDPALLGARYALVEQTEPPLTLAHLLADPDDRLVRLPAVPLLLLSKGRDTLLPEENTPLRAGDRILFAGAEGIEGLQRRTLNDDGAVHYLRTGREPVRTWLGRLLEQRRQRAPGEAVAGPR
jgi:Trk K+ transport system NAD-binding subunit